MSADSHGNTPAAWTAVAVALAGFLVGSIGLMFDPVKMPVFWVGVALGVGSLVVFAVMVKLGLHGGSSANSAAGARSGDH
ncbi:HGxxPAAW family protein [Nocardioides perillae]|uniref:Cyanate permease n=1 Tax=Nocardioides perillae TaxID=1119534 RepID=A0A7Y9UMK4_9ACTN|nr:HGxxPAAW family protein [Nocardioides perillae]NYG56202.1 cyanate permease [Nocardioides perillae]